MKLKFTAFLVALVAGVALSQTTLGNMFQLGQSTTANLPASSSTITGALLYDLDAGAPKYNDGTAWQSFCCADSGSGTVTGSGYIWIDGGSNVNWAHGISCGAGYVLTTLTSGSMYCVNTINASTYSTYANYLYADPTDCSANQYATGIATTGNLACATITGGQVSGAVATATALASDPSDCSANQYATNIAASGALTCAQVATSQLSGTVTDAQLANNYSGVGVCTGNNYVQTLNDNAAPTCTTPTYASTAGEATNLTPGMTTCASGSYAYGIDKFGNALCRTFVGCCGY